MLLGPNHPSQKVLKGIRRNRPRILDAEESPRGAAARPGQSGHRECFGNLSGAPGLRERVIFSLPRSEILLRGSEIDDFVRNFPRGVFILIVH